MNLKTILICYIFIFAINLSKTTKIQEIIPNYPFPSHLEKYYNLFASQSGLLVLEKLDSKKLEVFNEQEKFINKIIDLGNELPELLPDTVKSFAQNLSSLGLSSGEILLSAGLEVLNYNNPYISSVNDIRSYIFQYKKDKKDELNNKNNIISYIIQQNLSKTKYNIIIKDEIEKYLEPLIKERIFNLDFNDFIDFINLYLTNGKRWEKVNSIFKEDIDSINFILLGNAGSGKSRLINDILDLQSGKDGPFVNQKYAEPTTMGYEKYGNLSKKGIELIDSRGAELSEKYDMKINFQNLNEYFKEQIMLNNCMFIYSFIYLSESNSFSESDFLKNLVKNHYNKIPLKIIFTKSKNINQTEMLNNSVRKNMKINDTKIYFLQSYNDEKYKENINNFLKDLIEELDEEKLKDIYNYYYSLNIFEIFKKLILNDNIKGILLCQISDEKNIDLYNYMSAKLILDLNILLGDININFENTRQKMKNIYNIVFNELNSNLNDYELKNYEDKGWIHSIQKKFLSKPDYNVIIFQEISKKINSLIIDIYLKEIKEKLVNNPIEIDHYPNFTNIRTNIIQNYIKDYSQINSKSYKKLIIIIGFIIFIVLIVFIIYYYSKKRSIFKKPENDIELELVDNSYVRKI